ncbi:MAG: hypothetical protein A2133_10085 [Actinobacteria bacterium RBG_16_64_13]|nr:MAG: hypothetical protein A2133_10085 [Actinobacteria bacterium RBG_16_64_13]
MSGRNMKRWIGLFAAIAIITAFVLLTGVFQVLPGSGAETAAGAVSAPQVVSTDPVDNQPDCPIFQTFKVTFDQDMDPATLTGTTLYIYVASGFPLPATVTYDVATKTATLVPLAKLTAGSTYFVRLSVNVKSSAGLSVQGAPLTWYFHTLPAIPPRVLGKSPVDGAVNCPVSQVISITFDSQMDGTKFTPFSFYFAKRGGPVLPATITYDAPTMTAILKPVQILDEASTYDVTLIGTATGINGMFVYGAPITWSFNTVLVQPPSVITKTPADGAQDQPLDIVSMITFDRDMNKSTITADSFYLQKVGGARVDTIMTANERGATLTPKIDLDPSTTYQVTLTADAKSVKGESVIGAPITWTFKTKAITSPYSDVSTSYRYFAAIYQLEKRGIISGFSNGTFRPSSLVTRQQFAKMIIKALGVPVSGSEVCPFTDVVDQVGTDPLYPSKYVAVGAIRGIIQGKTATLFAPNDNVTRYQAITMVIRAIDNIDRGLLKTPHPGYQATWDPSLSATHGQNARLAEFNGLLAELPLSQLNPAGAMTRGEVAQLLWNLVKFLQ